MRTFLLCLLLNSPAVILAKEMDSRFVFPPFAREDIEIPAHSVDDYSPSEELQAISAKGWRGIMATGDLRAGEMAVRELLARGDQKTILRLVYSMKQGNVAAIEILKSSHSLAVVPYLMEDVAHGSLEYYGSYSFGDAMTNDGRVREAAVECVGSALFMAPELKSEITKETGECVKAICRGDGKMVQALSDKSRYLLQWWLLNEDALLAGKWDETRPLPQEIIYSDPKEDTSLPRGVPMARDEQPPYGSPTWEIPEAFQDWAGRIVDPKRRNLDFVALSWDGRKVIEHPARALDSNAKRDSRQERERRRNPVPEDPLKSKTGDGSAGKRGIPWIIVTATLMMVLPVVRWLRRKPA